MARPSKPVQVLEAEGKSHRTKAELEFRREQEAGLLTGKPMESEPAVKADKEAHTEFCRVRLLMEKIGRNDALYQNVINRYAKLQAEVLELEELRRHMLDACPIDMKDLSAVESMLLQKRKSLFDIEKENCMTVAASLRAVPKTPPKDDDEDPLRSMLE